MSARLRAHRLRAMGCSTSMLELRTGRVTNAVPNHREVASLVLDIVDRYNSEDVQKFNKRVSVLTKHVLLLQLMIVYDVRSVSYVTGNGNFVGLLSSYDTRFWNPLSTEVPSAPQSSHVDYT